jgi:transposase-like protein
MTDGSRESDQETGGRVSPEVPERPVRRRFDASYKLRILKEADRCTQPGQLGHLLRREGLYSSHLSTWRQQREQGVLSALTPKRRGRNAKPKNPLADELARLERENQRLRNQLRQAELVIDVQKKVSEMLDIPLKNHDDEKAD